MITESDGAVVTVARGYSNLGTAAKGAAARIRVGQGLAEGHIVDVRPSAAGIAELWIIDVDGQACYRWPEETQLLIRVPGLDIPHRQGKPRTSAALAQQLQEQGAFRFHCYEPHYWKALEIPCPGCGLIRCYKCIGWAHYPQRRERWLYVKHQEGHGNECPADIGWLNDQDISTAKE